MWSDNESSLDLLGFQHLVGVVTAIVRNESLLPATIGVYGDWGSGKTSLLRMVEAELGRTDEVLVLTFNGWLFEGYEDAKAALMGSILDALAADKTITVKGKELAARLIKRVNWFRVGALAVKAGLAYATGDPTVLGVPLDTGAANAAVEAAKAAKEIKSEDVEQFIREDTGHERRQSILQFRTDFEKLLAETKRKRLVVIIDDLDRCMPSTIIETLEAIKLFLFVPHTAFIIGADERLVRYAVRRRFPELPGERADVGRDYLEKLVQFPVRVPPLGRNELETYIGLLFARNAGLQSDKFEAARRAVIECDPAAMLTARLDHETAQKALGGTVPGPLGEALSLAHRIAPTLAAGTSGNPRQCKRFLNALMMRLEMAKSRGVTLQQRALAKLMLLEYYRPESFKQLARAQAVEEGRSAELTKAEQALLPKSQAAPEKEEASQPKGTLRTAKASSKAAREAPDEEPPAPELALWLSDSWVMDWVKIDPSLADVDLRPYFFFSRDLLGPFGDITQRMTPRAQEVLAELFHASQAVRGLSLGKAKTLTAADAAAVFEALAERSREEEDRTADTSAFQRAFDWVQERAELFGQLMTLLVSLTEDGVPFNVPARLLRMATDDEKKRLVRTVLEKWSKSGANLQLKGTSDLALKKL
ncbi:MAG: hypothetical protein KJZ54_02085 [Phycisphaerales bacterium]|nr:hypothetical protein [Phycisphaerales bacterium]